MAEKKNIDYTLLSQGEEPALPSQNPTRYNRVWNWKLVGIVVVVWSTIIVLANNDYNQFPASDQSVCPQYSAFKITSDERRKLEKEVHDELTSSEFFDKSLKKLQGAIQIPTESFDNMGKVGEDSRWDVFADLHAYLQGAFPLV
jgi:Gly-Xaa carboxypeptidase